MQQRTVTGPYHDFQKLPDGRILSPINHKLVELAHQLALLQRVSQSRADDGGMPR